MITELCKKCNNYFDKKRVYGKFAINCGNIAPLDFLQEGQYFRIIGSVFNDGVYQYPCGTLTDEIFEGAVWAMNVPPAFIALTEKIKDWCENNKGITESPYSGENYPNGYSYTVATGSDGLSVKWEDVFKKEIAQWRKL